MYLFEKEESGLIYAFKTVTGIIYRVEFSEIPDLLNNSYEFSRNIFELSIAVNKQFKDFVIQKDTQVGETVASIVADFLAKWERIIVFFCYVHDNKHHARNRNFSQWFDLYNNAHIFYKEDFVVKDSESDLVYLTSIILRNDNPFKEKIIQAFIDSMQQLNESK
jgi:hypothetical protein